MIRLLAVSLIVAGILLTTEANAGWPFAHRKGGMASSPAYAGSMSSTPSAPMTRVYSYSYYSRTSLPARTYVGYGTDDFPFHGMPYGHPYDAYTFDAMAGSYQASLARYYDPPVK